MSNAAVRHTYHTHPTHTRAKTPDSPRQSTSHSNTPSRSQHRLFEPQPRVQMDSPTPTTRKRVRTKRGTRKPHQRDTTAPDGAADQEPSSEDELMNLLGVGPAPKDENPADVIAPTSEALVPKGGVLPVTKEDLLASTKGRRGAGADKVDGLERQSSDAGKRSTPRKRGGKKDTIIEKGFDPPARGNIPDDARDGQMAPNTHRAKPSTLSEKNKRPLHDRRTRQESGTMSDSSLVPFDMSALSQSLPNRDAGLLGKHSKGVKVNGREETPEWDMPAVSGAQELTVSTRAFFTRKKEHSALTVQWQQKLQVSTPGSSKGSRPPSDRKTKRPPSAFNQPSIPGSNPSRPSHQRRASADSVPVPVPPQSAPPHRSSGFDDDIPYHIGFNVHRAPQTPAKGAIKSIPANTPLPIIPGEFPRINKVNKAFENVLGPNSTSGSSLKYAGPTAHSSPHAASLAKPDLDDF